VAGALALQVHFLPLDLSRLHTVVEFCELFLQQYNTHPHVLVNNAGNAFSHSAVILSMKL
jgi:NAD(P)-dependent dehydrogenase (short-subunit alcohol dehydrogenase family)